MASKIVVQNHRFKYHTLTARSWKVLTTYTPRDIPPEDIIPDWLIAHWRADAADIGHYARFTGLTAKQALSIISLTKTGNALLCTDRWGRVSGYKLTKISPQAAVRAVIREVKDEPKAS